MKLSLPQFPEVKGVFVGGCVERGEGSSFRRKAHAHTSKTDPYFRWICFRSKKRVGLYTLNAPNHYTTEMTFPLDDKAAEVIFDGEITKPSMLMKHEAAHIITGHGHDDVWRKKVREIGGQINWWETKKYFQMRRKRIHTWVFHRQDKTSTWYVCNHDRNPHYMQEMKQA